MRFLPRLLAAACLLAGAAALAARQPSMSSPLTIVPISSPAAPGSGQPQLTTSDRGVVLSWIEQRGRTATLKYAERTPSGWSEPRTVASGDDWFVNWADVPSVVRLADGTLAAHWLQKSAPGTYAYDVRLSYSRDNGRSWAAAFSPHDDGTRTEHGFASLVPLPGEGLALVWLDGRAMTPGHGGHGGGAMSLRFARLDRDWKPVADGPVDLRVCECCPTTMVLTSEGLLVAYRNRSEDEVRDIHVSRFEGGAWTDPVPVHADGWRIPACPVNGPSLSASGREVAVAWFTTRDDQPHAYAAFSHDAGRTFGAPIRLDDEASVGRVDIVLLRDGSALASYIEYAEGRTQFRIRRVEPSGARSVAVTVAGIEGSRASGYPRLAVANNEAVLAWIEREQGSPRVRTAVAAVPLANQPRVIDGTSSGGGASTSGRESVR